jgi:DnaJ like chaperone protein
MSIWGKIVGGAAGFAVGGPLGALLGGIAGHAVDRARDEMGEGDVHSIAFTIAVIALGAKMAKADGRVTADEVAAFREVFRVPESEVKNVSRVFNQARKDVAGFEAYAGQIGAMFRTQPNVLENLLDGLFHIARADGHFVPDEDEYLRRVALLFGFSETDFARIREAHVGPDKSDPYRVLGVARDAPADQIKKRWRELVRENHPDAMTARGVPQEFIDLATQKVAAINAAYDRIEKERGLERAPVRA